MAMTNKEILMMERVLNNIDFDLEINTYAGWNRQGYTINKGSKALFQTKIWKPCKNKKETDGQKQSKMYLVKASYFSINQVTKIKQSKAS